MRFANLKWIFSYKAKLRVLHFKDGEMLMKKETMNFWKKNSMIPSLR